MDEVFGRVGGRFRISVTDSILMWILHCAMDKAHERVQSKEGVIERLNEISKFYELALMQLEVCFKVVQEETDSGLESSDEELLGDLAEIQDRLERRLKESELAISEKDRELMETLENELKLTRALEQKERELDSLRAKLKLERTKSESIEELLLSNRVSVDEDRDEEFSELRNSVQQQVRNIKQQLGPGYRLTERRRSLDFDNLKIEQMSSDIDILKETMDVAFGRMQGAIVMSELEPIEQQWMWSIEKDTAVILIKGLISNVQENFQAEARRHELQVSVGLMKHLSDLMKDVTLLHDVLEPSSTSQSNLPPNISLKTRGRSSSDETIYGNPEDSIKWTEIVYQLHHVVEEEVDNGGNLVAKMIKNHESIIRRKSEEQNWLNPEIQREKGCSFSKRVKDPVSPRRRLQDVISRLENLTKWCAKLGENSDSHEDCKNISVDRRSYDSDVSEWKTQNDTLEDVWKKVNKTLISPTVNEELDNEIRILKEEKEDADLQANIIEVIYIALLESLIYESCTKFYSYEAEFQMREHMNEDFVKEIANEWKEKLEAEKIEVQIREEIYCVLLREAVQDLSSARDAALIKCDHARAYNNCLVENNIKGKLREEVLGFCFQEMYKEWSEDINRYDSEGLVMEDVSRIAYEETIEDMENTVCNLEEVKGSENCMCDSFTRAGFSVEEEVCKVYFREMSKEWKEEIDALQFESLVREEIFLFVVADAVKEVSAIYGKAEKKQDHIRISEDCTSANKFDRCLEVSTGECLLPKQDPMPNHVNAAEDLFLFRGSKMKRHNANHGLLRLKHEELNRVKITRELFSDIGSSFASMSAEVGTALEQMAESKRILTEVRSSLGVAEEEKERSDNVTTRTVHFVQTKKPSSLQKEKHEELKTSLCDHFSTPIMRFTDAFMDFKRRVEERLAANMLRLEQTLQCLSPLSDVIVSLRRTEWHYREAFIRKCENLNKAEMEVDLLGDQVDMLLGLLEKIYKTLHHYSPVLQQYFEVSHILKTIEKELI